MAATAVLDFQKFRNFNGLDGHESQTTLTC